MDTIWFIHIVAAIVVLRLIYTMREKETQTEQMIRKCFVLFLSCAMRNTLNENKNHSHTQIHRCDNEKPNKKKPEIIWEWLFYVKEFDESEILRINMMHFVCEHISFKLNPNRTEHMVWYWTMLSQRDLCKRVSCNRQLIIRHIENIDVGHLAIVIKNSLLFLFLKHVEVWKIVASTPHVGVQSENAIVISSTDGFFPFR